ncbi:MAG TPA: CPBP family intramembrane glutamic endopeptidase [Arenimonas sp.]|nr:CPBP family intramembrane glutamic endopeptidase [Arenimonas sp.]
MPAPACAGRLPAPLREERMSGTIVVRPPSRRRWLLALVLGTVLWAMALAASFILPQVLLGLRLGGATYAIVGVLQLALGAGAIYLACRVGGLRRRDIGFTRQRWKQDLLVGLGVAAAFALLQFGLIIPLTGGAERSDVVANLGKLQGGAQAVYGMATLGILGAISEELLFRGLILHAIAALLGGGRAAWVVSILVVTALFGAVHGYQGWAGIVDTALYGGLTLSLLCLWRGGRLAAAMAAHAAWNAIALVCLVLLY